jgi:hypothetical protein
MTTWDMLANAAWLISALIAIWMVVDLLKVSKEYPEEFLTSSREGQE